LSLTECKDYLARFARGSSAYDVVDSQKNDRPFRILYDADVNEKLADELAIQRTVAAVLKAREQSFEGFVAPQRRTISHLSDKGSVRTNRSALPYCFQGDATWKHVRASAQKTHIFQANGGAPE
jgi:hypothetical protein